MFSYAFTLNPLEEIQNVYKPVNFVSSVIPAFYRRVTPLEKDPNTQEESHHTGLKQSNITAARTTKTRGCLHSTTASQRRRSLIQCNIIKATSEPAASV